MVCFRVLRKIFRGVFSRNFEDHKKIFSLKNHYLSIICLFIDFYIHFLYCFSNVLGNTMALEQLVTIRYTVFVGNSHAYVNHTHALEHFQNDGHNWCVEFLFFDVEWERSNLGRPYFELHD